MTLVFKKENWLTSVTALISGGGGDDDDEDDNNDDDDLY